MPLKNQYGLKPPAPPAAQEPSFLDRLGGIPGLIGTGIRAVTGVASAEGGPTGALISGGGEAAAQLASGEAFHPAMTDPNSALGKFQHSFDADLNDSPTEAKLKGFASGALTPLAQIIASGSVGAVPFGAVLKEGRPIASAVRGAAYGGAGAASHELASGQQLDPLAIGTQAAIGGAVTGGLAKLLGTRAPSKPVEPAAVIEPTNRGMTWNGKKIVTEGPPRPIKPTGSTPVAGAQPGPSPVPNERIPYGAAPLADEVDQAAINMARTKEEIRDQRNLSNVMKWQDRTRAAAQKAADQEAAAAEIARVREGLVPQPPTISESISSPIPGGRESMHTSFKPPEEGGDEIIDAVTTPSARPQAPPPLGPPPPGAGRAREIYEGWVKLGVPEKTAIDRAANGVPPPLGVGPQVPPTAPVEGVAPSATYLGEQEGVGSLYNVQGGPSHASTVSADHLAEMGIPVPPGAPTPAVSPLEKVLTPGQSARKQSYDELLAKLKGEPQAPVNPTPTPTPLPDNVTKLPSLIRSEQLAQEFAPVTDESIASAKAAAQAELAQHQRLVEQMQMEDAKATSNQAANVAREGFKVVEPAPAAQGVDKIAQARATYPDEVNAELDKLGEAYRSLPAGPERRDVGKQMAELRDFFTPGKMRESWRGAPAPEGAVPPVEAPAQPAKPTRKIVAEPSKPVPGPDYPAIAADSPARPGAMTELEALLKAQPRNPERGAIDPALMARILGGGVGAAVGGAADPLHNRMKSALTGAGIGIAAASMPAILHELGAAPAAIRNLAEKVKTPDGVKSAASDIWQTLPNIQRFNYLSSGIGLPANAVAGPYGSAMMGALEHGLAGDPRGWEAMRALHPQNFFNEFKNSFGEARELLGRAEGHTYNEATNAGQRALAAPGTAMTAGDVAARRILESVGFSPEEARRITLTSEPETALGRNVVRFGKSKTEGGKDSALAQLMLPFKRTTTNILEQGAERIPGLGFFAQAAKDVPDPIKQQLIQQGIGTAVGGAGFVAGDTLDPATAKIVKRVGSNAAGQYSLPFSLGMSAGQAMQKGKGPISGGITEMSGALPLPTVEPMVEWAKFLSGNGPAPRGAVPSFVRELSDATTPALKPLPRLRRSK